MISFEQTGLICSVFLIDLSPLWFRILHCCFNTRCHTSPFFFSAKPHTHTHTHTVYTEKLWLCNFTWHICQNIKHISFTTVILSPGMWDQTKVYKFKSPCVKSEGGVIWKLWSCEYHLPSIDSPDTRHLAAPRHVCVCVCVCVCVYVGVKHLKEQSWLYQSG